MKERQKGGTQKEIGFEDPSKISKDRKMNNILNASYGFVWILYSDL